MSRPPSIIGRTPTVQPGTVWYLPLEPYQERYTGQLRDWTIKGLNANGLNVATIEGTASVGPITTGVALDVHRRSTYSLLQMATLVQQLEAGSITKDDTIFFADLFTPGYEALPYVLSLQFGRAMNQWPNIWGFCHAQSVDQYDFTHAMRRWMRHYEWLFANTATGILVADDSLRDLLHIGLVEGCRIDTVGHIFDPNEVCGLGPIPFKERSKRVVFTSRFDSEKQPHFFMDVVDQAIQDHDFDDVEFAVLTGAPTLRSNVPADLARLQRHTRIKLYANLNKGEYYNLLSDSRVHLSTALQDFVSYTLLEASALGTASLLPAFRSFPAQVHNRRSQLYVPWSVSDCVEQLKLRLDVPLAEDVIRRPALHHAGTIGRIARLFSGE